MSIIWIVIVVAASWITSVIYFYFRGWERGYEASRLENISYGQEPTHLTEAEKKAGADGK